ncbi:MAG TPA: FAD-dependent monooxygenase [Terriglobales bacterium]|nr:FAD-dependent monooxygenase [Terriglobales bacterium]
MSQIFDVAVIGGGPAGSSAAIAASHFGFTVMLLEAGTLPRHRVCGEFVSGEALSLLTSLIGEPLLRKAPRIARARIFLDGAQVELPIETVAASVSRYTLDMALWQSAMASGCNVRDRTRVKAVRSEGDSFVLEVDGQELHSRSVINASGRWSNLRAQNLDVHEQWIGLKGHFFEPDAPDSCDLYFFKDGYCGLQSLGNGIVNAAAMVKPKIARNLEEVFALNRQLEIRARRFEPATEFVSTAPLFFRAPRTSDRGMLLVGDAAAFLDPFAGDGISMALHSGRLAALALAPYLQGVCSLSDAIENYEAHHRALIQPALRSARRLRRLSRLPRGLRNTTMFLLRLAPIAGAVVRSTRVRSQL